MGVIALPPAGTIYVDANAVIYRVERIEPYLSASAPLWDAVDAGKQPVLTSQLTLLEVLVKPLRDGNSPMAALFRAVLLGTAGLTCYPVTRGILERAAQLRASHNLKTPDALHAATALETGCVVFVTNDTGFRRVTGLNVAVLAEIAASCWRIDVVIAVSVPAPAAARAGWPCRRG
jgi:predicted nucleic acid-binding protein